MQRSRWGGVAPGGRVVDQDVDYLLCGPPPFMQGLIAEVQQGASLSVEF